MSGRIISTSDDGLGYDNPIKIRVSLDLVTASGRFLSFLRSLSGSPLPTSRRSIQRYEKLWMPLIADLIDSPLMILPPADVNWIWYCHCLHDPAGYREYCALRFGAVIDRPAIFDEENEEYAILCCREIWEARYPSEPFDLETDGRDEIGDGDGEISMAAVKYRGLVSYFADVFVSETVYQVSARVRYLDFLNLARKFGDESGRLVPASDVLLMWLTHKSFPLSYAKDLDEYGNLDEKIVGFADQASEEELEETRRIWEDAFDEPYERSGALFNPMSSPSRVFFNWDASDANVNRVYKGLQPRFLLEVLKISLFERPGCKREEKRGMSFWEFYKLLELQEERTGMLGIR